MELRHLRYFVAVAETLSFRQASKQLRVSQPSLSVQIKQLENELGVVLFRRSKRRVEITRAGEVFLSAAREILLRLKQASAAALHAESGEEQSGSGSFRLRLSILFPGFSRRSEALFLS
jgi:DNA-binding transcriptional LysR family regulator